MSDYWSFILSLAFVFFEKCPEILRPVEQTDPLLVIQRDGKTSEAIR